jgi:hypothetical protein
MPKKLLNNSFKWMSLVAVRLSAAIALISFGVLAKRISSFYYRDALMRVNQEGIHNRLSLRKTR